MKQIYCKGVKVDKVGYIENEAGQKLKIEFVLDENHSIVPKSKQDREILISAWDINDEILDGFIDFVNNEIKDDKERIALLTNTQEYEFLENEEIYNKATLKTGKEVAQKEIESLIDKICDSAIFGYENLMLCPKEKL